MNVNDIDLRGRRADSMIDYIAMPGHRRRDARRHRRSGCAGRRVGCIIDLGRRDRAAEGRGHRLRPGGDGVGRVPLDRIIDGADVRRATSSSGSPAPASTATACRWRAEALLARAPLCHRPRVRGAGPHHRRGAARARRDIYVPEALEMLAAITGVKVLPTSPATASSTSRASPRRSASASTTCSRRRPSSR